MSPLPVPCVVGQAAGSIQSQECPTANGGAEVPPFSCSVCSCLCTLASLSLESNWVGIYAQTTCAWLSLTEVSFKGPEIPKVIQRHLPDWWQIVLWKCWGGWSQELVLVPKTFLPWWSQCSSWAAGKARKGLWGLPGVMQEIWPKPVSDQIHSPEGLPEEHYSFAVQILNWALAV